MRNNKSKEELLVLNGVHDSVGEFDCCQSCFKSGLGISRSFTISGIGVSIIGISKMMSIAKRVWSVPMNISMGGIIQSISIGLSLTLGYMNSSCGVGNVSSSTGIGTSNSWDSSWGGSVDSNGVGNIGNSISNWMVDYWGSI